MRAGSDILALLKQKKRNFLWCALLMLVCLPMEAENSENPQGFKEYYPESDFVYVKGGGRNYNTPVQPSEQKEISYVVETLGSSSLVSLAKSKSSLERSGKQVDHVHPLKFLTVIFTSEKLKAAIHNIRGRSWVWGKFFKGLKSGLEEESNRNNVLPYLKDFSQQVKIDVRTIYPLAEGRHWKEFIDTLLSLIPRSENSGRYDM